MIRGKVFDENKIRRGLQCLGTFAYKVDTKYLETPEIFETGCVRCWELLFRSKNCASNGRFGHFNNKLFRIAKTLKEKLRLTSLPAETPNATKNPNKNKIPHF